MRSTLKLLSLLFITLVAFSACSKDDDPVDNDLFIGVYKGKVTYGEGIVPSYSNDNGKVTVAKVTGDTYNFLFDDAPDLTNIKMTKGDNNTIKFSDGTIGTITITASDLDIIYVKDGKTWTADCKR